MPRNQRIAVRLDPEMRARLNQLAERTGRPLSHVIRAALYKWAYEGCVRSVKIEQKIGAGGRLS